MMILSNFAIYRHVDCNYGTRYRNDPSPVSHFLGYFVGRRAMEISDLSNYLSTWTTSAQNQIARGSIQERVRLAIEFVDVIRGRAKEISPADQTALDTALNTLLQLLAALPGSIHSVQSHNYPRRIVNFIRRWMKLLLLIVAID